MYNLFEHLGCESPIIFITVDSVMTTVSGIGALSGAIQKIRLLMPRQIVTERLFTIASVKMVVEIQALIQNVIKDLKIIFFAMHQTHAYVKVRQRTKTI